MAYLSNFLFDKFDHFFSYNFGFVVQLKHSFALLEKEILNLASIMNHKSLIFSFDYREIAVIARLLDKSFLYSQQEPSQTFSISPISYLYSLSLKK